MKVNNSPHFFYSKVKRVFRWEICICKVFCQGHHPSLSVSEFLWQEYCIRTIILHVQKREIAFSSDNNLIRTVTKPGDIKRIWEVFRQGVRGWPNHAIQQSTVLQTSNGTLLIASQKKCTRGGRAKLPCLTKQGYILQNGIPMLFWRSFKLTVSVVQSEFAELVTCSLPFKTGYFPSLSLRIFSYLMFNTLHAFKCPLWFFLICDRKCNHH